MKTYNCNIMPTWGTCTDKCIPCIYTCSVVLTWKIQTCYLWKYTFDAKYISTLIMFSLKHIWYTCKYDRLIVCWCLTPLSEIFQLYRGDQFLWWKKPEYPERTTDHGQATGKLYHLRLRVTWALFVIYKAGRIGNRLIWVVR